MAVLGVSQPAVLLQVVCRLPRVLDEGVAEDVVVVVVETEEGRHGVHNIPRQWA